MIFNRGIRFYETTIIPKSPDFKSKKFETVSGHEIKFYFYKEECEDLIHRRGKIRKEVFTGYTVQAHFDDEIPIKHDLRRFNNMKFFFNGKDFPEMDEQSIADHLLEVYMDFIRSELNK